MRSRYTAFALGDEQHLRDSWFPATRPDEVALDPATIWLGLDVLDADTSADGRSGRVRFRAKWRDGPSGAPRILEEHSRFVRRAGRWYYVDAV